MGDVIIRESDKIILIEEINEAPAIFVKRLYTQYSYVINIVTFIDFSMQFGIL